METLPEKHLYIYTKRRARIEGKPKYVGLIPKLFGTLFNSIDDIPVFISDFKKRYSGLSNKQIFNQLLNDSDNYIYNTDYIFSEDIQKIKEMNLKLFDTTVPDNIFDNFLEHLFYGHGIVY